MTREAREYVVTGTALVVALEATGTLERLWPEAAIEPTGTAAAPVPLTVDEVGAAFTDEAGRVVIDPAVLDLSPYVGEVDIGTALVLECPFEEGCTSPTPAPSPLFMLAPTDTVSPRFCRKNPDDPLCTGATPEPTMAPLEFVAAAPVDPVGDYGLAILAAVFAVVLLMTMVVKRVIRNA